MSLSQIIKKIFNKNKTIKFKITTEFGSNIIEKEIPIENTKFRPLVLYWISKKKKGYEIELNNFPKWFLHDWGLDFNKVLTDYITNGFVKVENKIASLTEKGYVEIKNNSHIIWIKENPIYEINPEDFENNLQFRKIKNNDIIWSILNKRIKEYFSKMNWSSLAKTYCLMGDILIQEKRYKYALSFLFTALVISLSGMKDNNELSPISEEKTKSGNVHVLFLEINNYIITSKFLEILEKTDLTINDLKTIFFADELVENISNQLPFKYFEKKEIFRIFELAIEKGEKSGIFSLNNINEKLKNNVPNPLSTKYFYASTENMFKREFGS